MKYITTAALAALFVTACGGGDDEATALANAPTQSVISAATPIQATEDAPTPEVPTLALASDAPLNNLNLSANAIYSTTVSSSVCGYQMPSKVIRGSVSSVHDGDTIKIGSINIRLDSIDAPELAQTYGNQSRDRLASLLANKQVSVYYSKIDKYGRTVGSVFTDSCVYVNLEQVRNGSAWHYTAYQCEQPATTRAEFAAAQQKAEEENIGLWAFLATPPWFYRNGVEPSVPSCTSPNPNWLTENYPSVIGTGTSPSTGTPSSVGLSSSSETNSYIPVIGCKTIWVNSYTRKDGTRVKGYYRRVC